MRGNQETLDAKIGITNYNVYFYTYKPRHIYSR